MNVAAFAPSWIVWVTVALLAVAAAEDVWRLRISNYISMAVLGVSLLAILLAGPTAALWQNVVVFAAILAVGTFLFSRGWMGGGDVKLFAAISLWFKFDGALRLLVFVLLAGGAVAALVILVRLLRGRKLRKDRIGSGQIPYGVAIALGAALALYMSTLKSTAYNSEIPVLSMATPAPYLASSSARLSAALPNATAVDLS
ncbi:MAG: prepilin peptidase [Sphingomicrobium sp.]